jgi:hypothetical protein
VPAPQWVRDVARRLKKRRENVAFEAGEPPRLTIEEVEVAGRLDFTAGGLVARETWQELERCLAVLPG